MIISIEKLSRAQKRYRVVIEGEDYLDIHEDVLISFRLAKGSYIHRDKIEQIMLEEEKKRVERDGLRYLSYRPRAISEMKAYLMKKNYSIELIDELLAEWQKKRYLDDAAFARQWIEERMRLQKKGRYVLKAELMAKDISTDIIEHVLEALDSRSEYDACLSLATKKIKSIKSADTFNTKVKVYTFLQRKGYEISLIHEVWKSLQNAEGNES
jgi:regulatory protein